MKIISILPALFLAISSVNADSVSYLPPLCNITSTPSRLPLSPKSPLLTLHRQNATIGPEQQRVSVGSTIKTIKLLRRRRRVVR